MMRMEDRIRTKLTTALTPDRCEIVNDSARHAGHDGHAGGPEGETHFNVMIVAQAFAGLSRVARHRWVTGTLAAEFADGLHAFQLTAMTPAEAVARFNGHS
jgi:BolA family transcriptional regulator, general stress-responsive regulator